MIVGSDIIFAEGILVPFAQSLARYLKESKKTDSLYQNAAIIANDQIRYLNYE